MGPGWGRSVWSRFRTQERMEEVGAGAGDGGRGPRQGGWFWAQLSPLGPWSLCWVGGGRERLHRCEQMSRWRCAPPLPDGPGDLEAQGLSRPARGGSEVEGSLARGQRNLCSGQAGRVRRALEPGSPSLSGHRPLLPGALWPVLGPSPTWACCPTTGRAWFLPCPRHRQGGKSCACSPA